MTFTGRPFRVMVAAFTGVWTSVLCCCAVLGHGPTIDADALAAITTAQAAEAHPCCGGQPADPDQSDRTDLPSGDASTPHDCNCAQQANMKISQSAHQTLPPLTSHAFAFDLSPMSPIAALVPAAGHARPTANAPPVPPGALSLFAQACLLTI